MVNGDDRGLLVKVGYWISALGHQAVEKHVGFGERPSGFIDEPGLEYSPLVAISLPRTVRERTHVDGVALTRTFYQLVDRRTPVSSVRLHRSIKLRTKG